MKIGLLGAGKIGKRFCNACKLVEKAHVVAVASATPNKAQQYAQEMGIPSYYDSYESMLKDADIDCVYICTTHNFHYENLLLCIEYNKHIICEKPMVLTQKHAEDIFFKAKEKKLFVMEAFWTRFIPSINKAKQWIFSGRIGDVKLSQYILGFKAPDDPNHRVLNPNLAGGALYDIGIYSIMNTTYLVGQDILEIKSFIDPDSAKKVDLTTSILIRFSNSIGMVSSTFACNVDDYCTIYGTKGKIIIQDPFVLEKATLYTDSGTTEIFEEEKINGFEFEIAHAIECIEQGLLESPVIPHKDTIECAGIFDKCFAENKKQFR